MKGSAQYETFGYPDSASRGPRWENFFTAVVRGQGSLGPAVSFRFEARGVADDVGFTAGAYSLRNASRQRPYLSLISATLDYQPAPELRVSVGKQIVNWSVFDGLQPANLLSTQDTSDVFRPVAGGLPAVAIHYGAGSTFAELVVVPLAFTPSRLPQGRWDIVGGIVEERQDLPPVRLNETQAGIRLGAQIAGLDASLVGYVGRDPLPNIVGELVYVGGEDVFDLRFVDRYPLMRAGGATGVYPVGERLLLRAESVYYNSPDRRRDDFLHTIVGGEYPFGNWRVLLNYLRDDRILRAPEEITSQGERRFFESFFFWELRYDGGRRLRARARLGYDLSKEFLLAEPEVSYRVWRGVRVALTGDIIGVGDFSYFSRIRHEDRLGTRLEYPF